MLAARNQEVREHGFWSFGRARRLPVNPAKRDDDVDVRSLGRLRPLQHVCVRYRPFGTRPTSPNVEVFMATYDFILSGLDSEMPLQGAASTDAEAWREAILFLSEMLREKPVREGGAFSLQIIVRNEGREICRVGASAH